MLINGRLNGLLVAALFVSSRLDGSEESQRYNGKSGSNLEKCRSRLSETKENWKDEAVNQEFFL